MKIVICGNYGATNIGDDAILQGILDLIEKNKKDAEIFVISHDPDKTAKEFGVKAIPRIPFGIRSLLKGGLKTTLKVIKESDLMILGGGGLFVDTKWKAPMIWGIHAFAAHLFRKPIYLFANSIGPLKTLLGKFIAKKVLKWSKIVSLRDSVSVANAHELFEDKKYKFVPDPAFVLEPQNRGEEKIIISMRLWTKKVNKSTEDIAKVIDKIAANNRSKIVLVPFQAKGEEDMTFLNNIFERTRSKEQISVYKGPQDFRSILDLFNGAKLVIGMRLHSLIFGAITETPIIGINYSEKVANFMKDLNLEDYIINPEEIDKIPELADIALKNAPKLSEYLHTKTEENRRLLYSSSLKLSL